MPEEQKEEQLSLNESFNASLTAGLAGGIIGAIIGVLLSLFAVFNLGFSGLFATIIFAIGGFAGGFLAIGIITFVWNALPSWLKKPVTYLLVIAFVVGIILIFITIQRLPFTQEYLKFASPAFDSVSKGFKDFTTSWGACMYLKPPCPFLIDWETPNVQSSQEELSVKVTFSDTKINSQSQINVLASISVKNPELSDVEVIPKCYFGKDKRRELRVEKMGSYSSGDKFIFGTTHTDEELHTTFRCVGDISEASDKTIYSEYITVVLERPVSVKTVWPVQIGQEPKMGIVRSEMMFNAPYSIAMLSDNDMPFAEGQEYDFQVVLKRRQEDAKLKSVEYINIKYTDDVMASCEGFQGIDHELELKDYSYDALKNATQYDKDTDKFSWPCTLYIASAPTQSVLAPIELESKYTVYSDYNVRVVKSP